MALSAAERQRRRRAKVAQVTALVRREALQREAERVRALTVQSHVTEDQFEPDILRKSGIKKLKCKAVPPVSSHQPEKPSRKLPHPRRSAATGNDGTTGIGPGSSPRLHPLAAAEGLPSGQSPQTHDELPPTAEPVALASGALTPCLSKPADAAAGIENVQGARQATPQVSESLVTTSSRSLLKHSQAIPASMPSARPLPQMPTAAAPRLGEPAAFSRSLLKNRQATLKPSVCPVQLVATPEPLAVSLLKPQPTTFLSTCAVRPLQLLLTQATFQAPSVQGSTVADMQAQIDHLKRELSSSQRRVKALAKQNMNLVQGSQLASASAAECASSKTWVLPSVGKCDSQTQCVVPLMFKSSQTTSRIKFKSVEVQTPSVRKIAGPWVESASTAVFGSSQTGT